MMQITQVSSHARSGVLCGGEALSTSYARHRAPKNSWARWSAENRNRNHLWLQMSQRRISHFDTRTPSMLAEQSDRDRHSARSQGTPHAMIPWEAVEVPSVTVPERISERTSPRVELVKIAALIALTGLVAADPASASELMPATRDLHVSKTLFAGASLLWTASSLTWTMLLTSRFMMSWFPRVERARAEEPWVRLARPVDLLLDPVRRAYGLTERTLVRVRSDAKDPDGRRQRARQSDRLNVTFLGGVDIAAPAALALVMLLGETLGPDGALMGTEMPEALETAHASVTILQMSSLLVSWWLVWARFFYFI